MYITLNTLFCIPNTPPPPPTRENNSTMDIFGISINFQFAYILESGDESADSTNWIYLMNSMLTRRRRRDRPAVLRPALNREAVPLNPPYTKSKAKQRSVMVWYSLDKNILTRQN